MLKQWEEETEKNTTCSRVKLLAFEVEQVYS